MDGRAVAGNIRPPAGTRLPGWLVATLTLGLGLTAADYALARLIGPWLVKDVPVGRLQASLNLIALVAFGVVLVVAFGAGLMGAARGIRRGVERRWANLVGVLFGCALVPGGLLTYALAEKLPISVRPTEINLGLIAAGAVTGWLVSELRRGQIRRAKPEMGASQMISAALILTLTGVGFAPSVQGGSRQRAQEAAAINSGDIVAAQCDLISIEESGQLEIALIGVTLGASFAYKETGYANGTWEAEVTEGLQGGLTLGLGEHIGAQALTGTALAEGLSLSMKALGDLERVNTYEIPQKGPADRTVKLELLNFLDSTVMLPGESQLSAGDGTSAILAQYQAEYPTVTDLSLNGTLNFSVEAGVLILYNVDMTMGAGAGVILSAGGNPSTNHNYVANPAQVDIYINLRGEGGGEISTLLATFGATAAGEAVLTMEMAPNASTQVWLPTLVQVTATLEGGLAGGFGFSWDQLTKTLGTDLLASKLAGLGAKSTETAGVKATMTQTLSFKDHPEDLVRLQDFFAAYQKAVAKNATRADLRSLQAKAKAFGEAFQRDGEPTLVIYVTDNTEQSVQFQMGTVFVDGASAGQGGTTEKLLLAMYRNKAGHWVASSSCVAGNSPAVVTPSA